MKKLTWKKSFLNLILFLGDLTELQIVALRWRALAQQVKDGKNPVHFKVLYEALKDLDKEWDRDLLSNEEVSWTGFKIILVYTVACEKCILSLDQKCELFYSFYTVRCTEYVQLGLV